MQHKVTTLFSLLTMSLVTVSAREEHSECVTPNNNYYVKYSDGTHKCLDTFANALNSVKANETAEIVFLKETDSWSGKIEFKNNVVLNLNGSKQTLVTAGSWVAKGANVTIKNGTIEAGALTGILGVDASEKATTLTIDKDVTIKSSATSSGVVTIADATKAAVVNVNGTWKISNEIVDCSGVDKNLTVNLNATVTANALQTSELVSLDAGNTTVNVNGGSYTTNKRVFHLQNGTLNINAGSLTSDGPTIVLDSPTDEDHAHALNIKGGNVTSTKSYALWFSTSKGTYALSGNAKYTSGKDAEDKQLPAIYVNTNVKDFLDKHPAMISSGTFIGSIVGEVQNKDGRDVDAEDAEKILVGNATVSDNIFIKNIISKLVAIKIYISYNFYINYK